MFFALARRKNAINTGRKALRPVLFFVALIVVLNSLVYADIADDFLRKGHDRMRNNDYRQAITYFESAYRIDPDNKAIKSNLVAAYHNMAILNSQKGDNESSIRNGLQALRLDPTNNIIKEQLSVFYNNFSLKLLQDGKFKLAHENINKALEYSPASETINKNLYNILLQYADSLHKNKKDVNSLKLAKQALRVLPDEVAGYILTGSIYYSQDRFSDALKYWNKAISLDPGNSDLKKRIESLKREKSVESGFFTRRKNYFSIRFDRELDAAYVSLILDILDDARRGLRDKFNFSSDEIIPVIIYDDRQFQFATDQPHWTQGLYDGKIRIRYQDVSRDDKNLRRVLFHEYAHAMLYLNLGTNIPLWLNEGFAQYNEPETGISSADKAFLAGYMKKHKIFSIEKLDEMFMQKADQDAIRAAYLQAKLFFNYLYDNYKKHRIKRLFDELKQDRPWQQAIIKAFAVNADRLEANFNIYLDEFFQQKQP
jgi:tetratricopeptide (TPR) repeat protein